MLLLKSFCSGNAARYAHQNNYYSFSSRGLVGPVSKSATELFFCPPRELNPRHTASIAIVCCTIAMDADLKKAHFQLFLKDKLNRVILN